MARKIHLLEVRSELGAGTRGASLGLGALKVAALNAGSDYFRKHPITPIANENELLFQDTDTPYAKYISGINKVYDNVSEAVSLPMRESRENFVIVMAGDHSTAGGTIAGLKNAYPHLRLGVIWMDAHADLHSPYTTPSGNVHGMPLAASLGIDNLERQRNPVDPTTSVYWNRLKESGGVTPKMQPDELVFIGLRSTEEEEDELIRRLNIRVFEVADVRQRGALQIANETLEYLKDCDMIYVSFDVDSMDSELVSRGTGTPEENGLTPDEAQEMLSRFAIDPRNCCLEVTEINPTLDNKCNKMAETAFSILEAVTEVAQQRLQAQQGMSNI